MFEHDNEEKQARQQFTRRAMLSGAAQLAGFSALGWRLFELQVVGQSRYAPLADENRISLQVLAPKRGRILDRTGLVFADNEEIFRVALTPALAGDVRRTLAMLSRIVPLSQDDTEKFLRRAKKLSRQAPIVVVGDLTFEQVAAINVLAPQLAGVRTEIAWRRKYRQGPSAGHLVGYVGSVERPSPDDNALTRLPGARVGKAGIEAGQELELRGNGGSQKIEVDARGRVVRTLETLDPTTGGDVVLTIGSALQKKVFSRLVQERRAAAVALDVTSGEVVVMASTPAFDPAEIADGITDESWRRLSGSDDKPLLNRAIGGQYAPGSIFKIVTGLAALHNGLVTPDEKIGCTGIFEFNGQWFRCRQHSGHGQVGLQDAIRETCDVYFFELARRLGVEALAGMSRTLGFGQTFQLGLAQQRAGSGPDADRVPSDGTVFPFDFPGDGISAGIGQGSIVATPLQLAVMMARVATGKRVEPVLIRRTAAAPALEFPALGLDERHLAAMRNALIAAVNEDTGTGHNAQMKAGYPMVAGKDGSSQMSQAGRDASQDTLAWDARDHALFAAYVPAAAPRYAVVAVIEHGGDGGTVAAPLVRDVIEAIFETMREGIDPSSPPAAPGSRQPGQEG